jgi:hypothetical protein
MGGTVPGRIEKAAPRFEKSPLILFIILLIGLAVFISGGSEAQAEQVTLAWDANGESDLAGYKLHLGTASNAYTAVIDVANQTSYTVNNLDRGTTYFFSVTAYNTQGNESDYSNEVDKTVVRQYQLTVGKRGSGQGTVSGQGIHCGADCQGVYDEGSLVTLNVNPESGSRFTGWSGDDCSGLGECRVTMWSDKSLTAGLLGGTKGATKKNQPMQTAAGRTGPRGADSSALGNGTTALPAGEATSYYVITRKTDRRGTTSSHESLANREAVLRVKYTAN